MIVVPGAAGEIGVLARHAPLVATLKAGSTRIHLNPNEMLEFATGPGFFKVELDRALALVDDAVSVQEIDDARAREQLEAAKAELEKVDAGESQADRWQLEQRIKHAENQLAVSGSHDRLTTGDMADGSTPVTLRGMRGDRARDLALEREAPPNQDRRPLLLPVRRARAHRPDRARRRARLVRRARAADGRAPDEPPPLSLERALRRALRRDGALRARRASRVRRRRGRSSRSTSATSCPGGVVAHQVGAICPDETALHIPAHEALALADGAVRWEPGGPLAFVPDEYMDDAAARRRKGCARRIAGSQTLDFRPSPLAHGEPVVGTGREALAEFAG